MLLINELRYITRQPLLWLCFLAAPLFAFTLSAGLAVEGSDATNQIKLHLVALQMMQLALLTGALAPTFFYVIKFITCMSLWLLHLLR